jgi:hypothetical protein
VLAGAAATALVTANLFYAIFLPFLGAYHLAVSRGGDRRSWLAGLGLAAAGSAGLFLVFGAVNRAFGGPFFYLAPSLRFLQESTRTLNPFRDPTYAWVAEAAWLALPALALAGAVGSLVRARREPDAGRRRFILFTQLQLLGLAGILVFFQVQGDTAVLQHFYYSSLLLPAVFLALAAQLPRLDGLAPRSFALLFGSAALALAVLPNLPLGAGRLAAGLAVPVLLPLVAGCGIAVAPWLRAPGVRVGAAVLGLALCQLLAWDLAAVSRRFQGFGGDARGLFLQVARSYAAVEAHGRPRLWYDMREEGGRGALYDVIATAWMLCPSMVSGDFPDLHGGRMCDGSLVVPGTRIAVLSVDPAALARAESALRGIGLSARPLGREEVPGPVARFALTLLEAVPAEGGP